MECLRSYVKQRSAKEQQALNAFKETLHEKGLLPLPQRMLHCGDEAATLLRFLHARKLDVKKAEKMLEDTLQFRKAHGFDTALDSPPDKQLTERMRKAQPNAYYGQDRDGHPLYLEFTGYIDSDAIVGLGVDSVTNVHIAAMEFLNQILCREAALQTGKVVEKVTAVMDAKHLTMSRARHLLSGNLFSTLSKIDSDHYPETMAQTFVINAPRVASMIFSLASPFLDAKTRSKIHICNERESMYAREFVAMVYIGFLAMVLYNSIQHIASSTPVVPLFPCFCFVFFFWCRACALPYVLQASSSAFCGSKVYSESDGWIS